MAGPEKQYPESLVPASEKSGVRGAVGFLLALICAAALVHETYPLGHPMLIFDDLQIVLASYTWDQALANLWVPANEHAMPLGRLTSWGLVQLAGRPTAIPGVLAWQGPLTQLLGTLLCYLFVRRELGHPFYGVVAAALFGVSTVYQQAITWFAASFSILALDTILLGLLAAQRWRQTGRAVHLVLCALWVALAPGWFASGILAGPLCAVYLFWGGGRDDRASPPEGLARRLVVSLVPVVGTAAFLAVSLPRTAERIMHTPHYGEQTAVEAFSPSIGLQYTLRSLVDNLLIGSVGGAAVELPVPLIVVALAVVAAAAIYWWRRAPARRLLVLGLAFIFSSYLLVYSARAGWPYHIMVTYTWARYHLLPQLGLVLFLCGGLPHFQGRWWKLRPDGRLSRWQAWALTGFIVLFFLDQLPHAIKGPPGCDSRQMQVLEDVEAVDALCREHHIAADVARKALKRLQVPVCGESEEENGWRLLRGSNDPRPIGLDEARRLLKNVLQE